MRRYASIFGVLLLLSGTSEALSAEGAPGEYDPMEPFQNTDWLSPLGTTAFMPLERLHEYLTSVGFNPTSARDVSCEWVLNRRGPTTVRGGYPQVGVTVRAAPATGTPPQYTNDCSRGTAVKKLSLRRSSQPYPSRPAPIPVEAMQAQWLEELGSTANETECDIGVAAYMAKTLKCTWDDRPEENVDLIRGEYVVFPDGQSIGSWEITWIAPDEKRARDAAPPEPDPCSSIPDLADRARCSLFGDLPKN